MFESVIKISQTPLPTIFVIAGIIFVFVGLGGNFKANIITDKINTKLATVSGVVLILLGVLLYQAPTLTKDIKITSDNEIVVGQTMMFTRGATTCHNLESITNYHRYLQSGNTNKINELLDAKWCGHSKAPQIDVVVLEIEGHFVKVKGTFNDQTSIVWIKDEELN